MSVFSHQTISKCLYSTSLVIKQTDSIVLVASGDLKCYAHDQQCCIFLSVLHGNSNYHSYSFDLRQRGLSYMYRITRYRAISKLPTILGGFYEIGSIRHSHIRVMCGQVILCQNKS